jgi:uncharacterized Zn finger protein (UPF0148 family)
VSVKCPACGFDSPDGAVFCDFCKEPFGKAKKAAPQTPDELAGLTKEQLENLAADKLLKKDLQDKPKTPAWLRPLAWTFLAVMLVVAGVTLKNLLDRYASLQP